MPSVVPTVLDRFKISGNVQEDIDNDDVGEIDLENVLISLTDATGTTLATTLTNTDGDYEFVSVVEGVYFVIQTNLNVTFQDVKDIDLGDLNNITVNLEGADSTGNDFVDERFGSISGSVTEDTFDGTAIPLIVLELKDATDAVVATTVTDTSGVYIFSTVLPGKYTVVETNSPDFPIDVRDEDAVDDGDASDSDTTVDNQVKVTLTSNEDDIGNNFVDSNKGSITGNVTSTDGAPLVEVFITLTDSNGNNVTTSTGTDGGYSFEKLLPGNYTVTETNPPDYPGDESDSDATNDGDEKDTDKSVDNKIEVTVEPGEKDDGNNFVDIPATPAPVSTPTTPSPVSPAPVTSAPIPKAPPTTPTRHPPEYCEEVNTPNCSSCAAFHSPGKSLHADPCIVSTPNAYAAFIIFLRFRLL
jgi:hypothetical protein